MVLLCICDGLGFRADATDNAVAAASKPVIDRLLASCPNTLIDGSGLAVGLPDGQMGNSEVGHLNLGAGRVVFQDITRIDQAIDSGDFFKIDAFNEPIDRVVKDNRAIHLLGLISDGKVHSSLNHLYALVELAKQRGVQKLYLHVFTDGRDTAPTSGAGYMREVLARFKQIGLGQVVTVGGRYYGMDRDCRWERCEQAYAAIVHGEGARCADPVEAIEQSYAANITDEFIVPITIGDESKSPVRLSDGDLCIMFNFRSDRVRQLSYMLTGQEYKDYSRSDSPDIELVTMTNYDVKLKVAKVAFAAVALGNILGTVLSQAGKRQLRTAETEKYAHVTFFFSGGVEEPFEGEDRDLIASPKVATYDLQPEMSLVEVTDKAVGRIDSGEYDFILLNYANCDMVGHTGIFEAARSAVEAVDRGLGRLLEAVERQGGIALVTADHGNAELMKDPETGEPWTAHTTNLVPFILFDPGRKLGKPGTISLEDGGVLADVAPTVLDIMGMKKPVEMTGHSLIKRS